MDPNNPINVCSLLKSNTNTFCRTQDNDGGHGRHQDKTQDAGRRTQDAGAGKVKILRAITARPEACTGPT